MSARASELLRAGIRQLRIREPERAHGQLLRFANAVLDANQKTNLTGAKDEEEFVRDQIMDSLAPLSLVSLRTPVVDIGSGAGLPGIPAAITNPREEFVLLEPRAKRAAFLESLSHNLGLPNVRVIKSSALGLGAFALRGKAGTVLMRAVAPPERALPLGLTLLRSKGLLLLYEGRARFPTASEREAARKAGGGAIVIKAVNVPGLAAVRHAWIVGKKN